MKLGQQQCRERLAAARVARLATADAAGAPHVVPVTFALDGDRIVTAVDQKPKSTTDLKRLRNIAANPFVALLADHYDDDWSTLWWVRADGLGRVLDSAPEALTLLAAKYEQYRLTPPGGPFLAIEVERWSGWAA